MFKLSSSYKHISFKESFRLGKNTLYKGEIISMETQLNLYVKYMNAFCTHSQAFYRSGFEVSHEIRLCYTCKYHYNRLSFNTRFPMSSETTDIFFADPEILSLDTCMC